jgi:phospholipid-binding lipoprotein MlaA
MHLKTFFLLILVISVFPFIEMTYAETPNTDQTDIDHEDDWALEDELDEMSDDPVSPGVWDPLEKINRCIFIFNDKLYFWCMKPVAQTYKRITPMPVRIGLLNFFNNINMPQRAVSCFFQLRPKDTGSEIAAFTINSTIGILGFTTPSKSYFHLEPYQEDLGQTLGSYGIGNGFYIVLPFLGSSTLRDLVGIVGDSYLDPTNYIEDTYVKLGVNAVSTVNSMSFRVGEYEKIKDMALEPYSAVKDGYIQYRNKQIEK